MLIVTQWRRGGVKSQRSERCRYQIEVKGRGGAKDGGIHLAAGNKFSRMECLKLAEIYI